MTAYNGALAPPSLSYPRSGLGGVMSADEAHGGTYSIRITGGGYRDIFYGCAAGSTTITVWVLAPVIGKCGIQVFDGQEIQGEDWNSGAGAWEQLSITFTALKKVYTVRLINATIQDGDTRAYFDDLV
ncbi:MAG: hypothetical protein IMZ46_04150 [Acidobacteria bacterium]|nr:hypothetical protein [Acidobacteriota bacterium]